MFNPKLIPAVSSALNQHLSSLYAKATSSSDHKVVVERKLGKIDNIIQGKFMSTITISEYLDKLWTQPELQEKNREYIVNQLETIQRDVKSEIKTGQQPVAKTQGNLDQINEKNKITPYEEYNLQEKVKVMKEKGKLDVDNSIVAKQKADLVFLNALNKPFRSAENFHKAGYLHYTGGLRNPDEEVVDLTNHAEEFVKKIREDRRKFEKKIKRVEKSQEMRDRLERERLEQKEREAEEVRQEERKRQLEAHVQELNQRSEVRLRNAEKWAEEQKKFMAKKPLYREFEENFKRNHILPELEQRKRKLQEIRALHRPIEKEDMEEHEEKVTKAFEQSMMKRKVMAEALKKEYQKPSYTSGHHQAWVEEMERVKKQKDEEFQEKVKRREKVWELWQEVKDNRMPTVDPQKELELRALIEKIDRKEKRSRTAERDEDDENKPTPRKLGNEYLKVLKEKVRSTVNRSKISGVKSSNDSEDDESKKGAQSFSNHTGKRKNYLHDLRKEQKIPNNKSVIETIINNKNLDEEARNQLLKGQVEKLEEKAKQKECLGKYKGKRGDAADVDEYEEVNQLYISTIKAKLEMLGAAK